MLSFLRLFFIVIWTAFSITLSLIFSLLFFNRDITMKMARGFWAPGMLFIANCKLYVEGLKNIPLNEPIIFISNHKSYFDVACLIKAIPINIHFIAKKTLSKIPFLAWYMYAAKAIFIDRSNPRNAMQSLDRAGRLIKEGRSVLVFPEGTRSNTGNLLKFKKGAFVLAKKANVKIIPVYIKGTDKVWTSNNTLKNGNVKITFGEAIENIGEMELNQSIELMKGKLESLRDK